MHKFPIHTYKWFDELPFDKFDQFKFSIYIVDFNWNYRFVNKFVESNLGVQGANLIGKNMWTQFPQLAADAQFSQMKEKLDRRLSHSFQGLSPLNGKRLQVTGYPLDDCFYFTASILPDKQELLNELRMHLARR